MTIVNHADELTAAWISNQVEWPTGLPLVDMPGGHGFLVDAWRKIPGGYLRFEDVLKRLSLVSDGDASL